MKKIVTLLLSSLIVLLMFTAPGNPVQAQETGEDCSCPELLTGSERNKIIATFLSSNEFKSLKQTKLKSGLQWKGISEAQVTRFLVDTESKNGIIFKANSIVIAVPFYTKDGQLNVSFFMNGKLVKKLED